MPRRPANVELLAALKKVLERQGVPWYVFGAQAAVVYGSARMTMDVDVTIAPRPEQIPPLVGAVLASGFASRVKDLQAFLDRSRVIPLVHVRTKMPLDLVVARDSLEQLFLQRSRPTKLGGLTVPVITPEDLVIAKLFAGRPRDISDVEAVLHANADLDLRYVRTILEQLDEAEDRAELVPTLERLRRQREE